MSGPPPSARTLRMVEAYNAKDVSLREIADQFGVSHQRVHEAVRKYAPEVMRSRVRRPSSEERAEADPLSLPPPRHGARGRPSDGR
jgi:transposase-like protein